MSKTIYIGFSITASLLVTVSACVVEEVPTVLEDDLSLGIEDPRHLDEQRIYVATSGSDFTEATLTRTIGNLVEGTCPSWLPDGELYAGYLIGPGYDDGYYYYSATAGTHCGFMEGPHTANFNLDLYRWTGTAWKRIVRSVTPNPDENFCVSEEPGWYRWRVYSAYGSGPYTLCLDYP